MEKETDVGQRVLAGLVLHDTGDFEAGDDEVLGHRHAAEADLE